VENYGYFTSAVYEGLPLIEEFIYRSQISVLNCKDKSVENTKSVLKTSISRTKDGKKSESEVAMCDRMQMYNIANMLNVPILATRGN
jgi:hypothetical protein